VSTGGALYDRDHSIQLFSLRNDFRSRPCGLPPYVNNVYTSHEHVPSAVDRIFAAFHPDIVPQFSVEMSFPNTIGRVPTLGLAQTLRLRKRD
jgi:hypothetical protein